MKTITLIITLFFFLNINANQSDSDNNLLVEKEGFIIIVVDFQEGDKIKLFEVETGEHILSKTRGRVDLSQLPLGKYLLESNNGKSVVVERTEEEIMVQKALGEEYVVNSEVYADTDFEEESLVEELENYYNSTNKDLLHITRDGDLITVDDFEYGDIIKLFEVKNTIHVLSKKTDTVDLSQLPDGKYVLENNKGQAVVVEKGVQETYPEVVDM